MNPIASKKLVFSLLSLIMFLSMYGQDYYWSGGRKIPLREEIKRIFFTMSDGQNIPGARKELEEIFSLPREDYQRKFPKEQRSLYRGFFVGKESFIFSNKEIVLEPKKGSEKDLLKELEKYPIEYQEVNKYGVYLIRLTADADEISIANELHERKMTRYCHPNFLVEPEFFNDPLYSFQYYLNNTGQNGGLPDVDINIEEAWAISKGGYHVKVAVLDDGIEAHEDLSSLVSGYSAHNRTINGAPDPDDYHGTSCAGIIGADHNSIGISGIIDCLDIIPVRVRGSIGIPLSEVEKAIDWAWDEASADVLSSSWGYDPSVEYGCIEAAFRRAHENGAICVFASGNKHPQVAVAFPANVEGMITVGAVDNQGVIQGYSSRGPEMDLVAPSGLNGLRGDIVTIDRMNSSGYEPGNYTSRFGGTSAAAPQVAGVAALMLSVNPALTNTEVADILYSTARDLGPSGKDDTHGHGLVDAGAAVRKAYELAGYVLQGGRVVCQSASTFSLNHVLPNEGVQWTTSSNIQITSGQGTNSVSLKETSPWFSGPGWVKAEIAGDCHNGIHTEEFDVWVGKPPSLQGTLSGPSQVSQGQVVTYSFSESTYQNSYSSFDWTLPYSQPCLPGGADCWEILYGGDGYRYVTVKVGAANGYIQVTRKNNCGNGGAKVKYVTVSGDIGGCPICPKPIVFPNPIVESTSVHFLDNESKDKIVQEFTHDVSYSITDLSGRVYTERSSRSTEEEFDFTGIQAGIYLLKITHEGIGSEVHRLVVQE